MYKLLIPEERAKAEREYRARRGQAVLTLTAILIIFGIVAMAPSLILALGKRNAADLALAAAPSIEGNTDAEDLLAWAESERKALVVLAQGSTTQPYEYMKAMLASKPATAHITSLAYSRVRNALDIGGIADDRSALLSFQSALVASGKFSKVDLPVNTLAKEKDIDFQFTLTPKQ